MNTNKEITGRNLDIINSIHSGMNQIMTGHTRSRMPMICFLGRHEYGLLISSGLTLFMVDSYDNLGCTVPTEYVMNMEIVKVDRDQFLMVV
jgi:hypothetical protein